MKNSVSLFLVLIGSLVTLAQPSEKEWKKHQDKIAKSREKQSAEISMDTLFFKGVPYCLYIEGKKLLGNVLDITVKDLSGTDVMWCRWLAGTEIARPDIQYAYEITFSGSGQKALYPLVIGDQLYREIVKQGLFADGVFQPQAESKFISFNPYKTGTIATGMPQGMGNQPPPAMVQRNRNAMIQVFGDEIKQDFKIVGYLRESSETGNGKVYKVLNITLPDGTQVARAQSPDFGKSWTITTLYDRRSADISTGMGSYKQEIATFLIGKMYL